MAGVMGSTTAQLSHASPAEAVLDRLATTERGLSDDEAAARLLVHGPNTLRAARSRSALAILGDQFRSVVVWLLVAAAGVAIVSREAVDAAAIGAVLFLNAAIGFVTELRARRAMASLLRLQAPRAIVHRGGAARDLPSAQLVPGDVIDLEAGQFVPADARVLETADLLVNEAALTGESEPAPKSRDAVPEPTPLPDRACMLFQGTVVVAGTARAVVVATGMRTELGRIGELVSAVRDQRTPLENRLDALGRRLVWLSLAIGMVIAGISLARGLAATEIIQTAIALAVAAVPEALPAVVTIALAVGVHRMARHQALIRRIASAETLGSVTVICTDKTGTLTAGQMTATVLATWQREIAITGTGYEPAGGFAEHGAAIEVDGDTRRALATGLLASRAAIQVAQGTAAAVGDPTDAALVVAAAKAGLHREALLRDAPRIGEVPFSNRRMHMASFHRAPGGAIVAHVKGAPLTVLQLCRSVLTPAGEQALDAARRTLLIGVNERLAARGLRVLGLAAGPVDAAAEAALDGLTFLGFVGITDPLAPGVAETIARFDAAGIRTIMITGDQQLTARAIAHELGLLGGGGEVLDGAALSGMDEDTLGERLGTVRALSRVSPESKLAIVAALQRRGEVVAMLGDGVNDAPALRKADVGVAMGHRGTDVAKDAADVVLQDDRFPTIGAAIEQGRVIFDNVRKFVFYLFSCNLAEVLVLMIAALAGWPLPLLPLQILWLNLLTDTFPALSLAVEPGEPDVMRRPPRDPEEAIFSPPFLRSIALFGTLIAVVTMVAFWIGLAGGRVASPRALTMSFVTLAFAQVLHLGNARSRHHVLSLRRVVSNPTALAAVALVAALQVVAVHWPPLAGLLGTGPLDARDWATCVALATVPAIAGQVMKGGTIPSASAARPRSRPPTPAP